MSCKTFILAFLVLGLYDVSNAYKLLPSFDYLKSMYPGFSSYGGRYTSSEIKTEIGGKVVYANYNDGTCAVRMSRALNKLGGHDITEIQYDASGKKCTARGGDGKHYIIRMTCLGRYLTKTYGSPLHGNSSSFFRGKKGIMRVKFHSNSGHFALWDGDGFYQSKDYFDQTKDIYLWQTNDKLLLSFDILTRVYPGFSDSGGRYTDSEIKTEIGGKVVHANYIDLTCALRMSRALNKVGAHDITEIQYDASGKQCSARGGDGKHYIIRMSCLARYLTKTYGSPLHGYSSSFFRGKKGIMRLKFKESSSYTGHFALWNGDGFYQSKDYFDQATDIYLWQTNENGGGCFPSDVNVIDINKGTMFIRNVEVGDKLLSITKEGRLQYSDVIGWLHRDEDMVTEFFNIHTADGKTITLSGDHIIFKADSAGVARSHTFASAIQVGDHVLTTDEKKSGSHVATSKVSNITKSWFVGVYAPLTREGTVIVDQVAASCYAAVDDHHLAHAALLPVRAVDGVVPGVFRAGSGYLQSYLNVLQYTARLLLDKKRFHSSFNQ